MQIIARVLALLIVIASSGAAGARPAAAQSTCPPEANETRAKVIRFLTSERHAAFRQQYGITGVNAANVVLLTDAANSAACQQLRGMVKPGQSGRYPTVASYYYADGFYFVPVVWVIPAGRIWTAYSPLFVFRSDFSYVDAFAM